MHHKWELQIASAVPPSDRRSSSRQELQDLKVLRCMKQSHVTFKYRHQMINILLCFHNQNVTCIGKIWRKKLPRLRLTRVRVNFDFTRHRCAKSKVKSLTLDVQNYDSLAIKLLRCGIYLHLKARHNLL